jgi:hypothetical protein
MRENKPLLAVGYRKRLSESPSFRGHCEKIPMTAARDFFAAGAGIGFCLLRILRLKPEFSFLRGRRSGLFDFCSCQIKRGSVVVHAGKGARGGANFSAAHCRATAMRKYEPTSGPPVKGGGTEVSPTPNPNTISPKPLKLLDLIRRYDKSPCPPFRGCGPFDECPVDEYPGPDE